MSENARKADKSHYDENRAIRLIRDKIMQGAPKLLNSKSFAVLHGHVTADMHCPDKPLFAVPLWFLFGLSSNPAMDSEDDMSRVIPMYSGNNRDIFYAMLCHISVIMADGDYVTENGKSANGLFRRSNNGDDAIRRFGTDAIIALPYNEVADNTSVALSTVSHELRHAWDTLSGHWSVESEYTSYHENAELYYKNPQEIRARVTEIAHQAEDVVHDLVKGLQDPEYAQGALRVLTEIFGSGIAVFSSWLYGLLTPFHRGTVRIEGDPVLPRPTLDIDLLQKLLQITAGAYSKPTTSLAQEEQHKIQDWMAEYSSSLYHELVSTYKSKLPSSVFHGDSAKTKQLLSIAHRNLIELKQELPNLKW